MLNEHPEVVTERLESSGALLHDQIPTALNGFSARPYPLCRRR